MGKFIDLTGKQFGRWTVIERTSNVGNRTMWLCECSCEKHTRKVINRNSLVNGHSTSCGCYASEYIIKRNQGNRKKNEYNLSGEVGIGYTSNTNEIFYFSKDKYDLIKEYTWFARHDNRKGRADNYYIEAYYSTEDLKEDGVHHKRKRIHLHHLVLGIDDKMIDKSIIVDHKNMITHDCCTENLRIADIRTNNINKPKQKNNTSGIIGVDYDKIHNYWIARININGKRNSVYQGKDKELAIVARLKAEKEYYGEYAPQKHLFKEYGME